MIKEGSKGIIKSLIFLIFGALIFAYPNQVVETASIVIGIALIAYGVLTIFKNYYETKNNSNTTSITLVVGIVSLIMGLIFIILNQSISQFIQYVLGAWILFVGIEKFITALTVNNKKGNAFITELVISILILLAGLYTILKAHIEIQIVGILMMIYAILEIIDFITIKKVSKVEEETTNSKKITVKDDVKEAVIIEEKESKKSKKSKK